MWKCVRSFADVDSVIHMPEDVLRYFKDLHKILNFKDTVSNTVWHLSHYPDNSDSDINIVLQYLLSTNLADKHFTETCVSALTDLASKRISKNAVVSKFVFECKYGE